MCVLERLLLASPANVQRQVVLEQQLVALEQRREDLAEALRELDRCRLHFDLDFADVFWHPASVTILCAETVFLGRRLASSVLHKRTYIFALGLALFQLRLGGATWWRDGGSICRALRRRNNGRPMWSWIGRLGKSVIFAVLTVVKLSILDGLDTGSE